MHSLPIILVALFATGSPVTQPPPIARTGPGSGPSTTSCSARVDMRDTDVNETRTMLPYTEAAPLTSISVDFCAALESTFRMENWGTFTPLGVSVTPRPVRFEVSFDPAFDPAFEIVSVDFLLSPLGFVLAPFDGTLDFAGPSAASFPESQQLLGVAHLAVDPNDAAAQAFFRAGFPVYFRTVSGSWTVTTTGGSSYADDTVTLAGGGIVFRWNQ